MAGENKYTPFAQFDLSVDITEGIGGAKAQTYLNQYIQAIKNLTDESRAFASELKRTKDKITQTVYVEQSMVEATKKSFKTIQERQSITRETATGFDTIVPTSFSLTSPEIEQVRFSRKINDPYKRASVASYVARHGGVIEKSLSKEGYYDIIAPRIPVGTSSSGETKYFDTEIKRYIRRINDAKKRRDTKIAEEKEAEKIRKEEEKAQSSLASGGGYGGSSGRGSGGSGFTKGLGSSLYGGTRSALNFVRTGVIAGVIITLMTEIVKLLGSIYSAVITVSREALSDATGGMAYGLNDYEVRRYRKFAQAKDLPEDTFTKALHNIQSSFANVNSIDFKSLSEVAPLLQGKVSDVVARGLPSGTTSKEVMSLVFNDMVEAVISRATNLGGTARDFDESFTSISTMLEKTAFKDLVPVLRRFFYEYNNPATSESDKKKMLDGGLEGWIDMLSTIIDATSMHSQDRALASQLAMLAKEVETLAGVLKEGILVSISGELLPVLDSINTFLRRFMSPDKEKEAINNVRSTLIERSVGLNQMKESITEAGLYRKTKDELLSGITDYKKRGIISGYLDTAVDLASEGNFAQYGAIYYALDEEGRESFNKLVYLKKLEKAVDDSLDKINKELSSDNPKERPETTPLAIQKKITDEMIELGQNTTSYFVETLYDPKAKGYISKRGSSNLFGRTNIFGVTEEGMLDQMGLPRALTEMTKSGVIQVINTMGGERAKNRATFTGEAYTSSEKSAMRSYLETNAVNLLTQLYTDKEDALKAADRYVFAMKDGNITVTVVDREGKELGSSSMKTEFFMQQEAQKIVVDADEYNIASKMGVKN